MYYEKHVFVCTHQKEGDTCCGASAKILADQIKSRLKKADLHGQGKIRVSKSGCLGRCSEGPNVLIYPSGTWLHGADCDTVLHALEVREY